jgi:long-chain acyl-CoA synthetase
MRSLRDLLQEVTASSPSEVAYRHKRGGRWIDVTWTEFGDRVDKLSRGLLSLGLSRGDRVAVLSRTRLEWMEADAAIVSAGGVTVGIYPASVEEECHYILQHCGARVLIVENAEQLERVRPALAGLSALTAVVTIDGTPERGESLSWVELARLGERARGEAASEPRNSLEQQDLAAIVYTSGTTGTPRGVMISHGNLLFTIGSALQCLPVESGQVTLVFLPLAHVFARLIVWVCMRARITVAFAQELATVPEDLREIRPHFITSVPRVFEKVRERVLARAHEAGGVKRKLFDWSLGVGRRVSERQQAGRPVPPLLRLEHAVADRLVLAQIRAAFGGRLLFAVSGAAPLDRSVAEFFHACGVLILEGIGMTENTSFSNVNRIDRNKFGTVGPVGPGIEMRIAPDGEVLFRGPNVMVGYYKDPAATAEAIDAGGWLKSGDIGEIDGDGFLKITDRKKDLIVTAGGKNVAPQRLERMLRASRYISHAVAHGDRQKYLTALVALELDNVRSWAAGQGLALASEEELVRHPRVNELIQAEIAACNHELASFETIKKFRILPRDLSVEAGELTPTLKIKRKAVYAKYAHLLAEMYD